jgi:hypothetical protein
LRTVIAQEFAQLYAPAEDRHRGGAGGPHKVEAGPVSR